MIKIIIGIFVILHGLVHFLYLGQSVRYFQLQPGMVWPDGSWAFSKILDDGTTRVVAAVFLVMAAIGFIVGGVGIFMSQGWWRPVVVGAAAFSAVVFLLFWDGKIQELDDKGGVGLLINLTILVALLVLQWPDF